MKEIMLDKVIRQIGNRTDGVIRYGQKADGSHFEIPVIIIKGNKSGPTLLVDGATHGDETEGPEGILRIAKEYENGDFAGTLVAVPAVNVEAFTFVSRTSVTDGFNLNRIFPGNKDTYITYRLAAVYIERVLSNIDAAISFHGGGDVLHLEPLCGYLPEGESGEKIRAMAEAFNTEYIWRAANLPFGGMTADACRDMGIPCLIPEVGSQCSRLHDREKYIQICYRGIKNIMIHLGMLDEEAPARVKQMVIELHYIHSYNGGIQTPIKQPREIVEQGETLCVMQDLFGNQIEELTAPWRGVVIGFWSVPVIHPGDWWSLYAKIIEE